MKMLLCLLLAICLCSGFAASNQANEIQSTGKRAVVIRCKFYNEKEEGNWSI